MQMSSLSFSQKASNFLRWVLQRCSCCTCWLLINASRVSLTGRLLGVAAELTLVHWRQMTRSREWAAVMQAWQKVCPQPMSTRGRRSWRSESLQVVLQAGQRRHSIPSNLNYINCKTKSARNNTHHTHRDITDILPPLAITNLPLFRLKVYILALSRIPNQTESLQWINHERMSMRGPNLGSEGVLMCRFVFYVEQFLSNVILIFLKEGMSDRFKGTSGSQSVNERMLEYELLHFITFVKRAPLSIQRQLLPYCFELKKDFPNDNRIKAFHQATFGDAEARPDPTNNSEGLIKNLFRILQLKYLPAAFNKTIERVEADRSKPQQRTKQQIFGKGLTFEKVEMLHPEYDTYYKMSKQDRGHHLPQHYPRNRFKEFYTEPRYLVRMEEMAHFHSNEKLKGDILFLHYEGNIITGSKAYAVARDRVIEHWEMTSSNYYPIPTLNIPAEIDPNEKKEEEDKKEKEKEKEPKNEPEPGAKFALNHVFSGHLQKITCISFSQDELYLISGSADRTVRLWCLRMKTCLATYRGHQRTIWDVHFSPSGYYFLSGSADGCMILWKTDEPHAQRVYCHKADVLKVSIAKDPSFVISAGEDGTIKIWKTLEAELIRELRLSKPVVNMNLGLSGSLLVAVESDGRISIFDLMKGETINSFYFYEDRKGKEGPEVTKVRVHDVCLSEDERELSCVTSKYVVIYSMERLEMKVNNNIYTFYENAADSGKVARLPPREIIYMGIETNLTYCSYQHKNVLVVAGSSKS